LDGFTNRAHSPFNFFAPGHFHYAALERASLCSETQQSQTKGPREWSAFPQTGETMKSLYAHYRAVIAVLFCHLSQEFRAEAQKIEKEEQTAAQAAESALKQEFAKVRAELAAASKKATDDLVTLKADLEARVAQVESHVETLDMKKYGPNSSIKYSNSIKCSD
jgi:hypothetical protein